MGVELHITRAAFWADNEDSPITAAEWLAFVESDHEFSLDPANGPYFARWLGASAYDEPWLEWSEGNISTKWPDTALYIKMLAVSRALKASVQDDDGNSYESSGDWSFDPRTAGGD